MAARGKALQDFRGNLFQRMLAAVAREFHARQSLDLEKAFVGRVRRFDLSAVKASCTCGGRGPLLMNQHKWSEAAACYRTKLKDPRDKGYNLNSLARALAHSGHYAESVAFATQAIRALPNDYYSVGTRGYANLRGGNLLQAEADLKETVHLNPNSAEDWYYLALTYDRLNKYAESAQALRTATNLGYEDDKGDYRLALN